MEIGWDISGPGNQKPEAEISGEKLLRCRLIAQTGKRDFFAHSSLRVVRDFSRLTIR